MAIIWIEILIIFLLISMNGFLAMSEIALVSARRARLESMMQQGKKGAATALEIAKNPNNMLATIQIGITLIGILAGAFGGATIAEQMGEYFSAIPAIARFAESAAFALVVIVITYSSLILGELVPKRIGMSKPEAITALVSGPINLLSKVGKPLVWFLSFSTDLVLKVFSVKTYQEPAVTEEEIKILIKQGAQSGALEFHEQQMVERVLLLGDRRISSLMTPRPDIVWINLNDTSQMNRKKAQSGVHTRYPVGRGRLNHFEGIVALKDLIKQPETTNETIELCLKQPLFVPESMKASKVIEEFKKVRAEFAMVVDEYGIIVGLVTSTDILQSIAGDIAEGEIASEPWIVQREDGSYLVDAMIPIQELQNTPLAVPLDEDEFGHIDTLAGWILARLGKIPVTGDHFQWGSLKIEVIDMDGNRIDKVLISRLNNVTKKST